jgi:hypothetical protein
VCIVLNPLLLQGVFLFLLSNAFVSVYVSAIKIFGAQKSPTSDLSGYDVPGSRLELPSAAADMNAVLTEVTFGCNLDQHRSLANSHAEEPPFYF